MSSVSHPAKPSEASSRDAVSAVIAHHERTKHRFRRYARAPAAMDWANEPDPFRRYRGAALLELDHLPPESADEPRYDAIFGLDGVGAQPVNRGTISQLFYDSLAISAWKAYRGARWSLRVNPSSGDLHPTEAYLIAGAVTGLHDRPAVFHYCPLVHAIEVRQELSQSETWRSLRHGLPASTLLIGLTSIYWRESWKYGERGFRYSQLDLGHAIAAIGLAAGVLGWAARLLEGVASDELGLLLGVHRQRGIEAEHAECLVAVGPPDDRNRDPRGARLYRPPRSAIESIATGPWRGRRNRLSAEHVEWPTIDEVAAATLKAAPTDADDDRAPAPRLDGPAIDRPVSARRIIRRRRSCLALDGETLLGRAAFYRMLQRTLPGYAPIAALPWQVAVHLLLFVHRVEGLDRGLYLLVRDVDRLDDLRSAITKRFEWTRPPRCPGGLPLYLLRRADVRRAAQMSACHQEIAADGAFAAAMLAEFEPRLERHGAWFYRRLHWEAGVVGQVLYLEAEAADLGSTGIGCFMDDASHDVLGLCDRRYQTVYHFTVGRPVEDTRLTSLPAYPAPDSHRSD